MSRGWPRVLWLTPDKPTDISVGRSRIGRHLREMGYGVTIDGTTGSTVCHHLCSRGAYDVVVGTTRAGALAGIAISAVHQIPLVVDHIDPITQFEQTAPTWLARAVRSGEAIAFRRASQTLFVYKEEQARVEKHAHDSIKTALGVDFDRFSTPKESVLKAGKELLDNDWEHPLVVYIGGLEPMYNIKVLLDATKYFDAGTLVVAGAGSLETTVRDYAASSDRVQFLGTVDHEVIPGLLAGCDVGVSLVDDPHTLKVLEYGAAGLPVVQVDGRAHQRFRDRVTYTETSPKTIASAIDEAVQQDSDQLQQFVRTFDWADIAETYATTINTAVSNTD